MYTVHVHCTCTLLPEKKRRDIEILSWRVEPRLLRVLGAGQWEGGGGVGLLLLHYMYSKTVAGVLDEPFNQLTPLSGVVVQAANPNRLEPSILCSLAGRYGYSAEMA
jgi:hypothetical protein